MNDCVNGEIRDLLPELVSGTLPAGEVARVQEHVAGMAVVRAYTMEAHAFRTFAEANRGYLEQSLRLARLQAQFTPLVSLIAGLGVVKLAQHSGRPIYAGAMATSRRIELDNWDRTAINLPFGRVAVVVSEAIYVPRDADDAALEAARQRVENELNRATARAYAIADRKGSLPP